VRDANLPYLECPLGAVFPNRRGTAATASVTRQIVQAMGGGG
jgi:hypothetical protein